MEPVPEVPAKRTVELPAGKSNHDEPVVNHEYRDAVPPSRTVLLRDDTTSVSLAASEPVKERVCPVVTFSIRGLVTGPVIVAVHGAGNSPSLVAVTTPALVAPPKDRGNVALNVSPPDEVACNTDNDVNVDE